MANSNDLGGTVAVEGLQELRNSLRRMSRTAPKVMQGANKEVAEEVSDKALKRMRSLGGVHAHAARMKSVRPQARADSASIVIGGAAAKHGPAMGAEFGALQYPQFPRWRGNDEGAGYAVWPTIRAESDRIKATYIDHLETAIRKAF